jgi:thermitase
MKFLLSITTLFFALSANAVQGTGWLVKMKNNRSLKSLSQDMKRSGVVINELGIANWVKLEISDQEAKSLRNNSNIIAMEKNTTLKIMSNIETHDPILRNQIQEMIQAQEALGLFAERGTDNPDIPLTQTGGTGTDPLYNQQWGMKDNDVKGAWSASGTKGNEHVIVAVLDTGVDYTHEDLVDNMWRNSGEMGLDADGKNKATNGIDDDGNGFIDDVVGWDFGRGDNKPYDLHKTGLSLLLGGNPGHGTHCAGNVAARADNGKGISGVAGNVKIMAMRFLTEDGQGSLEGAVQAIHYAVDNGAQILSNSWGSEGDDGGQESQALQDAIRYAMDKGVLFVAAAGNGHQGVGYDNDSDAKPGFPASYDIENIISVAALNDQDELGAFSNWGRKSVDIGAPGVKIFSTVPDQVYQDTVINIPGFIVATWDGTSMATPHVSGAAALYLSKNPNADWREIKNAILSSATPVNSLSGKVVTNGKLNVKKLMQ